MSNAITKNKYNGFINNNNKFYNKQNSLLQYKN